MPAASINDLPQELWNRIVQLLRSDCKTLLSLCLTSPRFVDEAQSHLYAVISVVREEGYSFPNINISQSPKLFSTVIHNPSLAKYVRFFEFSSRGLREDDFGYEDLRHALRLMVNLHWLEMTPEIPGVPHDFFQGCTFRLVHFRCNFHSSTDNAGIYKLLSSQPSLRSLYIDGLTHDFPSEYCTSLKRLIIQDWHNVSQLLRPGCSISRLEFLQIEPSFDSVPPSIIIPLGNLTQLTFQCHDPYGSPYGFLKHVGPHLTRLAILRIIAKDDDAPTDEDRTITDEPEILYKLTNLKYLIWSPRIYCYRPDISIYLSDQVARSVGAWFQNMTKLKRVYCQNYGCGRLYDYTCWEADGGRWSVVPGVLLRKLWFYRNY